MPAVDVADRDTVVAYGADEQRVRVMVTGRLPYGQLRDLTSLFPRRTTTARVGDHVRGRKQPTPQRRVHTPVAIPGRQQHTRRREPVTTGMAALPDRLAVSEFPDELTAPQRAAHVT